MDGKLLIAELVKINKSDEPDELKIFEYKGKLQDQLAQEIMAQYLDYLKTKYKIKVY